MVERIDIILYGFEIPTLFKYLALVSVVIYLSIVVQMLIDFLFTNILASAKKEKGVIYFLVRLSKYLVYLFAILFEKII